MGWSGLPLPTDGECCRRLEVEDNSSGGLGATPLGGGGDPLSTLVGLLPADGPVGVSRRILSWKGGPTMGGWLFPLEGVPEESMGSWWKAEAVLA